MIPRFVLLLAMIVLAAGCLAQETSVPTIDVFFKNQPPSLRVLERVLPLVMEHAADYAVRLHCITSPESEQLIESYGLPGTHFPFAVVVDGRFSALLGGRQVDFVHFPAFMHGIGRHEGNWSLDDLRQMLAGAGQWRQENVLPTLTEPRSESNCEDE